MTNHFVGVGDHKDCGTAFVDTLEEFNELIGEFRIDISGRLIRDQECGAIDEAMATRCCWPPESSLG